MNFMFFVAEELREYMAKLGIRTVDELIGRTDLLKTREKQITHRADSLDLSYILSNPCEGKTPHFDPENTYDFGLEKTKDVSVLLEKFGKALDGKKSGKLELEVSSTDRSFGTLFGSEITRRHKNTLPDDSFVITCLGGGGQSFGAFIPKGLTLRLEGDCNDGFGKGLSGGKLVLFPPRKSKFKACENVILGNVALYGATSGRAYIAGMAGERFCVRNSGAVAVVEGVGDHGCEYMTGGTCLILGETGRNFAAGMSGGIAYVLDEKHELYLRLNKDNVSLSTLSEEADIQLVKTLLEEHLAATGSLRAKSILEDFEHYIPAFKKVTPQDYDRMIRSIDRLVKEGVDPEKAQMQAFYDSLKA